MDEETEFVSPVNYSALKLETLYSSVRLFRCEFLSKVLRPEYCDKFDLIIGLGTFEAEDSYSALNFYSQGLFLIFIINFILECP